ncbi:MAG: hypothetical protein ACF8MJ_09660 [Phycisphaerales bacterium JB050]
MHTRPDTDINTIETTELLAIRTQIELERLRLELTMIRVQTKALETLERLMDDPEPTGNEKQDRFEATKRNRQRLAANQVLIHCRTAEREKRLAKSNAKGAPPSPLAGEGGDRSQIDRRMRGRPEPSENEGSPSLGAMAQAKNKTEGAGHADNGSARTPSHGLPPISDRTQTLPPKPQKFIKPKHPRRSRKRKRGR